MNNSDFFVAGGTLRFDAPSYVERPADKTLLKLASSGQLCYILTTRQMGKSSLMNRAAQQLRKHNCHTALIDLTSIGSANIDAWYLSMMDDLTTQLGLPFDAETWWEAHQSLSQVKRFSKYIQEIVLGQLKGQVAIFIDEVDSALNLPFSDDFFAAIRAIHNQSLTANVSGRLAIILLGVAAPNDLVKDNHRTPFNVGDRLQLGELTLNETDRIWSKGLPQPSKPIIERIFFWTSGHPYLTQKVARTITQQPPKVWHQSDIDQVIRNLFFTERAQFEESNLQFIQGRTTGSSQKNELLGLYRRIFRGKKIANDERSNIQTELKLYGLIKVNDEGHLTIRNRIYQQTFDHSWIKQHNSSRTKQAWRFLIIFLFLLIGGIGIYYWQLAQRTDDLLAETYRSSFLETKNPTLQLDNLANMFALPAFEEEGIALFNTLTLEEQVALFTNATPDLQEQTETAVSTIYDTLFINDIEQIAENSQLLSAMLIALNQIEQPENSTLATEIDSWLQGRNAALRGDYDTARIAYSVALSLNTNNHSVRYERVLAQLTLSQTMPALDDLTILSEVNQTWQSRVQQVIISQPQLSIAIVETDNYDSLAALIVATAVPTPENSSAPTQHTPTVTVLPAVTIEPASPIEPIAPTPTATIEKVVLIDSPISVPETEPQGLIVYTCFDGDVDQICTIEASGTNQQQLTFSNSTAWYASANIAQNKILYSGLETGVFTIFQMSLDGQTTESILRPFAGDYSPVFSPNGTQIAFTRANNNQQGIWLMSSDGSNLRQLTNLEGNALDPTWSPDGTQIAFAYQPIGAVGYQHMIIHVDGTNSRTLPIPLEIVGGRSDWSPQRQWIAFYAGPPGNHDIYLLATDGSEIRQLTNGGDNLAPSFSPDGNWIVFTSSRDGDNELYIMRLDGSGLTQLTNNELSDWQPRWTR